MGAGSKGRGDVVLGARHLFGIFALLVVMMGIVFTLGYVLGRSRYEDQLSASANSSEPAAAPSGAKEKGAPRASDPGSSAALEAPAANWDFYRAGEPAKPAEHLE